MKEAEYWKQACTLAQDKHDAVLGYCKALEEKLSTAIEALTAIHENVLELQPNSGHMYLANVNYCYKKANAALDKLKGEGE